jgi:hypothetical protein
LALGLPARAAEAESTTSRKTTVDFERHIMGIFGKAGCNSGSCHGSFQGRGGFRLSLFGYDAEKDYQALTREAMGRRVDVTDPESSLILQKATGAVKHGGERRFSRDSWQYDVLRRWIAEGAQWSKGSGDVTSIVITPPEQAFKKAGETSSLKVVARYADKSEEDITRLCDYRTNDDAVAEVNAQGQVKGLRAGDTAIIVSYRGTVLPVRVMVPATLPAGVSFPQVAEVNYVDREVRAKLRRLNIIPADLSSDTEFLRRVTIDTIGSLPSPDEVRTFLADKDPNKRAKKIDELLANPLHAALWATKFCDITGNNTAALEQPQGAMQSKRSQMWHDWFKKRIADNMSYDQIVKGVLCATSRDGESVDDWIKRVNAIEGAAEKGFVTPYAERASLDLFWRRQQQPTVDQWGEKTAAAFMGVRLECAQCHKHPFDRWTQVDYRAYANIFGYVAFGVAPEDKAAIDAENTRRGLVNGRPPAGNNKNAPVAVREVFIGSPVPGKGSARGGLLPHPETNKPLPPRALGGPEIKHEAGKDARVALFDWLRSPDNPFFARSFANRVWGHYFGVGIVDPVDNFSLANPPSNDKLLAALAQDFIDHKFDIRALERTILNSRTYQLSSAVNATNKLDKNNYSHSYVRPMMAEVVVDVLNTALGTTEQFGNDAPPNSRAIEVGSSRVTNAVAYAFRIFGRPPRTTACDCERALEPALPQKLYLMADQTIVQKLQPKAGRLKDLVAKNPSEDEALEEMFLATLSRFPTDNEKRLFAEYRTGKKDRVAVYADVLWALINTDEFILNH